MAMKTSLFLTILLDLSGQALVKELLSCSCHNAKEKKILEETK